MRPSFPIYKPFPPAPSILSTSQSHQQVFTSNINSSSITMSSSSYPLPLPSGYEPPIPRSFTTNIFAAFKAANLPPPTDLLFGPYKPPRRQRRLHSPPSNLPVPPGAIPYRDPAGVWLAVSADVLAEIRAEKKKKRQEREKRKRAGKGPKSRTWVHGPRANSRAKGKGVDNGDGGRYRDERGRFCRRDGGQSVRQRVVVPANKPRTRSQG